ncbi:ATP-binding protein [Enhygromyxa salina]|uniref:Recombination protein F n=1 Tax=Enhygromyxa salina TaxID=215803 RepID=A0A2S9YM76_9BACT|nr:ATP-binding protein [Enhygromyxa salina]PRQ06189.1 recombination protein F [Enhygromyxa salina]
MPATTPAPSDDRTQLLDDLERVLVEQFGLCSALERARTLLDPATLETAREQVHAATTARSVVRDADHGTLLDALEQARERERETVQIAALIDGWHKRERDPERALARLAAEVFVSAESLELARHPGFWEGLGWGGVGVAGLGAAGLGSAGLGSAGLGSAGLGVAGLGSAGLGLMSSAGPVMYLRKPKLRFCGHFEPEVDLLIHDPGLCTLAMVQVVDADEPAAIRDQVSRHVDRATYLRHLLLTAREQHPDRDQHIISVELVLVYRERDWDGDGQVDLLFEIGEILRDLALQTDCLHAIGINVLAAHGPTTEAFAPDQLRRAFSWLLRDSRSWFAALEQRQPQTAAAAAEPASFGRLQSIELDEYRLPGRRTLSLNQGARLHLLHGHNGSGKSSLVEALELMITGSIERLSGVEDYEHVVRNRWSSTPARIVLRGAEAAPLTLELRGPGRPDRPLAPGTRAASFRLDQTVMDRLARASDVDRAAELLAAFFADEAAVRERWRHAMDEAEAALARLPARVRAWLEGHRRERQDLHEVAVERLASLAEARLDADLVDAILPIPRAQLRPLLGQLDALAQLDTALATHGHVAADAPLWDALELAFTQLAADLPQRVRGVESVLRTLGRVGRWWQEGEDAGFDTEASYAEALDEWLELAALIDLADQQRRIIVTLQRAHAEGWSLARLDEAGAAAGLLRGLADVEPLVLRDLDGVRGHWAERREQLGRALRRTDQGELGKHSVPVAAARVRLDDEEVAELDRFGAWWDPAERGPGLGARIRGALERGETHSFASAMIGAQSWVTPIRAAATNMLEPLRELRDAWASLRHQQHAKRQVEVTSTAAEQARDWDLDGPSSEELALDDLVLGFDALDDADEPEDAGEAPPNLQGRGLAPSRPSAAPSETSPRLTRDRTPLAKHPAPGAVTTRSGPRPSRVAASAPAPPAANSPNLREPKPSPAPPARKPEPEVELGLLALIERLRQAHEISVHAHTVGTAVQDSFVARLSAKDQRALSLVDALNELLALFTPARWAYEDVILRYAETGDVSRLRLETGELRGGDDPEARARADLRLNTAQLNAFTLALFLLCAPRVDNPIGLLVLDDPLQNMDELTVTTLARGLAKLLRVLPRRWSLMMLFHGEGDLARFHDEVECGVYFLPWLSPTARGQQIEIGCEDEDSRLGLTSQRLEGLVTLRP